MIEYKIDNTIIINHGYTYLSDDISAFGQTFTQVGNIVYMLTKMNTIARYNLSSLTLDYNWQSIDTTNAEYACLTRSSSHFHAIGGFDDSFVSLDTVLSLHIDSMQWQNDLIPPMNQQRSMLSCQYVPHNDALFAIAGMNNIRTIERIVIGESSWSTLSQSLTGRSGGKGTRSVLIGEFIYVIGGFYDDTSRYEVHTI